MPSIEDLLGKKKPAPNKTDDSTQEELAKRIGAIGLAGKEEAVKNKAASLGIPYLQLRGFPISPEALRLLPREQAEKLKAIPFLFHGEEIRVGAVNPADTSVKEIAFQIGERTHGKAEIYMISDESLGEALKLYDILPIIHEVSKGVEIDEKDIVKFRSEIHSPDDIQRLISSANITDIMAMLLAAAVEMRSSDIHIEAEEKQIVVRFRLDGVLNDVASLPHERWKELIARVKLISGLKLNIVSSPQDGRFTVFLGGEKADVRVSTLPTAFGESVVMRLLLPSSIGLEFVKLGIRKPAYEKLEREVVKPNGMIITTGPTGSGKTTTLYAILKKLNTPDVKIITLEDPVEYKLEGINQSQIDHTKDYTFAKGLRSILRQDPDIVMVGEIRDRETAEVAVQASLTGHLLLSTIHTNDAAGAVPRFLSMGVDPALLAPALRVIMGQRLVRKLCDKCKKPATISAEVMQRITQIVAGIPENSGETPNLSAATFFEPVGCEVCNKTGYKGRLGVYEILVVNPAVEDKIRAGSVSDADMRSIAKEQGMTTMEQDGVLKAMDGTTDVDEVFRVAGT